MQKHYIFDVFKGQTTPAVGNLLHKYNCFVICVPSYYTDNFQTLDNFLTKVQNVSLQTSNCKLLDYSTADNLIAKHSGLVRQWSIETTDQSCGTPWCKMKFKVEKYKPFHANWLIQAYHYSKSSKNNISGGFRKAHITEPVKHIPLSKYTKTFLKK